MQRWKPSCNILCSLQFSERTVMLSLSGPPTSAHDHDLGAEHVHDPQPLFLSCTEPQQPSNQIGESTTYTVYTAVTAVISSSSSVKTFILMPSNILTDTVL